MKYKFGEAKTWQLTDKQFFFYFLGSEMVTCQRLDYPFFISNQEHLIWIDQGMEIVNQRMGRDQAALGPSLWDGVRFQNGYPASDQKKFCIAGGKNPYFQANEIEIYGVDF